MLLDTTFLIDLAEELADYRIGPARRWLAAERGRRLWTTVISAGEFAAGMENNNEARTWLADFNIARLHPEVAYEAAAVDRELSRSGERLGENDTWIAGFARYYGEPILSRDEAFDRVHGIRRVSY
jgi:predicted nucleic acid-binding protein